MQLIESMAFFVPFQRCGNWSWAGTGILPPVRTATLSVISQSEFCRCSVV
jgi:hypothetical protein